tara:strand:+ start:174 stop:641 length:468 start_codon:yes stop_codon:yes gene_type:complete
MGKNLKGGSKHKKMKNVSADTYEKIMLKDNNCQDYAKVEKLLGNCRVELLCNDKIKRMGIIRGNMRKRSWININNIVLYSKRSYEEDKVDIIYVYKDYMIKNLSDKMNLTFSTISNEDIIDDDICFTNEIINNVSYLNEKDLYLGDDSEINLESI